MKVKEQLQKEQENAFKENLSFKEWLNYFCKKFPDKEDDVKKESKKVSNNPFYHLLKGA